MSLGQTLELTALIATQGPRLVAHVPRISEGGLRAYWTHAKCRLVRWGTELRKFTRASELMGDDWGRNQWPAQRQLATAILLADLPTRAWTAVSLAHDGAHGRNDAGPLAENIFVGHTECRRRALQQRDQFERSSNGPEPNLYQLQRRCERFNDVLVGKLAADLPASEIDLDRWAYDATRAKEFAQSLAGQPDPGTREQAWNLTLFSLRRAFDDLSPDTTLSCSLHPRIISAVMSCFPHQSCDSLSLLPTLWQIRLQNVADDASLLLEEWLNTGE